MSSALDHSTTSAMYITYCCYHISHKPFLFKGTKKRKESYYISTRTIPPQYNWWQYNIYFKNRDAFIYRLSEYCGNKMKYNAHCKQCRNRSKIQEKNCRQDKYPSGTSPLTSLDWYIHFNKKRCGWTRIMGPKHSSLNELKQLCKSFQRVSRTLALL